MSQREQSPGPVLQRPRRASSVRGGVGSLVADDEQQQRLEVVKLRIDVLKHVTTLSGAATLILLTLAERAEGDNGRELGIAAIYFALSTMGALVGIMLLLRTIDRTETQRWTEIIIVMFMAGVLALLILPLGTLASTIIFTISSLAYAWFTARYGRLKRDSGGDKADDEEPE
jgi:hypothetical protein